MNKLKNHEFSILTVIGGICLLAIIFTVVLGSFSTATGNAEDISDKIIRFHVIANSDSKEDQAVKLKVKEAVIEYVQKETKDFTNVEETRAFLLHNTSTILEVAKDTLQKDGFDYEVNAELMNCYFPVKSYGDAIFPAGEYEAYRIELGEAKGQNWWCVLYPPLCFIDVSSGVLPDSSKEQLEDAVGEENYNAICSNSDNNVKFRFKYLSFLNGLFD